MTHHAPIGFGARPIPFLAAITAALFSLLSGCKSPQTFDAADGWVPLFNGHNLDGWWGESTTDPRTYIDLPEDELTARMVASQKDIYEHWSVRKISFHESARTDDGLSGWAELVNDGFGLYLTTAVFYRDFELALEYRTVAGADSGVYLRGVPQVQIWDTTKAGGKWNIGADKGSGGLWNNSPGASGKDPLVNMDRPFGEWNTLRVRMVGDIVSVWLNGTLVVDEAVLENYYDRSLPVPERGPIQLQTHGGEISWRRLFVREL